MEELKFYTFNPTIYPRFLWVAIGTEQFKDQFEDVSKMHETAEAQCDYGYDKINKKGGVFLRFRSLDDMTYGNVTHEALHVAMMIYEYIDCKVEIGNQEHLCYLAGWVAKCCEEVKKAEEERKATSANRNIAP